MNVWNVGGTWREHQRLPETPVIKLSFQNFSFQKIWETFKPTNESESETHKKSESETHVIKFSFQNFTFQKMFAIIKPTKESEKCNISHKLYFRTPPYFWWRIKNVLTLSCDKSGSKSLHPQICCVTFSPHPYVFIFWNLICFHFLKPLICYTFFWRLFLCKGSGAISGLDWTGYGWISGWGWGTVLIILRSHKPSEFC